jgi:hypothetical protein
VTRHEAGLSQVRPYRRQVFLLDAEHVDALTAGHFHGWDVEPVHHIGDGPELLGAGHAAPHQRHHRIGAVFLNVGVNALVHET